MKILDRAELLGDKEIEHEAKSFLVFIITTAKNKQLGEVKENGDVWVPFSFSLLAEDQQERLKKVCNFYGIGITRKFAEYVVIPNKLLQEYTYDEIVDNIKKDFE